MSSCLKVTEIIMAPRPVAPKGLTADADTDIDDLVRRVTECLSINEQYPDVHAPTKDLCIRNEILGLVRDGLDDLAVLARRIEASLSPAALSGEAAGKRELVKLSKEDEWYLVQEHLVSEERELEKRRLAQKKEDQAAKQREHKEFLRQSKLNKEQEKREKALELERIKQTRIEAEAAARRERAARRQAGEAVRADREAQVKRAKEKQVLVGKLKKVVDEQEKQSAAQSMRDERARLARERQQAQEEMTRVLLENQKSLEQKRIESEKEKEETIRCMEEYSKMLLNQEQQRQRQLERIHEIQRAQEQSSDRDIVAAGTKVWMDDAVVAKHAEARDLEAATREAATRAAAKQRKEDVLKALDEQVKAKLEVKRAELVAKAKDKERLEQVDAQSKENHRKAMQRAADKCVALKRGLDVQIVQQRKAVRATVGMNRTEGALNAGVLAKAVGGRA